MRFQALVTILLTLAVAPAFAGPAKPSSVSPRVHEAVDLGRAPGSERHRVVVSLDLRDRTALESLLADLQDPRSPRYHQFLTQDEFNARFAPTAADEQAVVDHLRRRGLKVTARFPNRLVVGAAGSVAAIERAFGVEIHHVALGGRRHFAAMSEPALPAELASVVVGVVGLDDLTERRPHLRPVMPAAAPHAALGSNCCHLSPNDLFTLYDQTPTFPGAGQTIVIAGAYAWRDTDNTTFNTQWGLPQLPAGSGQVCTGLSTASGCKFSTSQSIEIALDVEYAHGTAPGARILNYMAASTSDADFTTMYNRIVTDDPGHVVSTSWGACEAALPAVTQQADDDIFANANAIGQAWFAASGDNGSKDCGTSVVSVDNPANSPHVMGVGGTTPTCSAGLTAGSAACAGYGSETAWSGSGGGVSQVFARPGFQAGCGVPAGTTGRLVPDVALEADTAPGNYVVEGGSWWIVGGTSDAAPQWAGLAAELTQKKGAALGNPGAFLYGLCGTAALHDVTTGSNGDFSAGAGYDMVTGLGSFDAKNLLATVTTTPTTTSTSTTTVPPPTTTTTMSPTTTSTTSASTTTTTAAPPTATTTAPPSTTTTGAPTTTTSTTTTTRAPTTSTTTTLPACLPTGTLCSTNASCCSNSCKVKAGAKRCR